MCSLFNLCQASISSYTHTHTNTLSCSHTHTHTHTNTNTQPTGDSSYLYIYTFMGCCWMLHGKHTLTHTHTHTGALFLCRGLDGFRARVPLWLQLSPWCGVWVCWWGVHETLRGKDCTAHKSLLLISCCHSDTYLLNSLAWLRHRQTHTHTLTKTNLITRQDCREEITEKHCCLGRDVL